MEAQILLMKFFQNLKSNSLTLVLLLALLITGSPAFAQAQIAVVNLVRIYQEYTLVKEANKRISEGEDGLKRVITTAETEMKKIISKTDAASEMKKEEIQRAVDEKVEEIQDIKEDYNMKINRNIQDTINKLAKKKKYIAVFDKSFSVYAGDDITAQVLTELEKIK